MARLLEALVGAWRRDLQLRSLVVLVFFTLLSGTTFYSLQEGWSIVDPFYVSVTTLTTVGLGDLAPTTSVGKLFTVFYIFAGLSLVLGFIETLAKETFRGRTRGGAAQIPTGMGRAARSVTFAEDPYVAFLTVLATSTCT